MTNPSTYERSDDTASPEPDAQLVRRARAGDRAAFGAIYSRYADRVHDFCHSVRRDPHEAADVTQQTFLIAAKRLRQLREPDKLGAWLYAIARTEAVRRGRSRHRSVPTASVTEIASGRAGPEDATGRADANEIVWAAAAGLSVRDRALLDLTVRRGLDGRELADAIGASPASAYVTTSRLRAQVERAITALLVARFGRGECPDLDTLLAGWGGRLDPLIRKRVARHVEGCENCTACRLKVASPLALLAATPLVPAPAELRDRVLGRVQLVSHLQTRHDAPRHRRPRTDGFPPPLDRPAHRRQPLLGAAAVAAAVLLVVAVFGVLALRSDDDPTVVATGRDTSADDRSSSDDDDDRDRSRSDDEDDDGPRAGTDAPEKDPSADAAPPGVIPVPHDAAGNPLAGTTGQGSTGSGRTGLGSGAGGEQAPAGPAAPAPEDPAPDADPEADPVDPEALPADPANLSFSATTIDLGLDLDSAVVTISNDGPTAVDWVATPAAAWLAASPASGALAPDASTELTLVADREAAPQGEGSGADVPVSVNEEVVGTISVTIDGGRAPSVTNVEAGDDALVVDGCSVDSTSPTADATDVVADVVDDSGLADVVLEVTDPVTDPDPDDPDPEVAEVTEIAMTNDGAATGAVTWTAELGPFDTAGTATWSIVATDTLGHETRTVPQEIEVEACTTTPR